MKHRPALLASALLLTVSACGGTGPSSDQRFGNWDVKTISKDSGLLCYAQSRPVSSDNSVEGRGQPYLMATRRQSGKIEISASAGYTLPSKNALSLIIDGKTYHLAGKGSVAWAPTDWEDRQFLKDFHDAQTIVVSGEAENGTSLDYYASNGFGPAIDRVKHLCP